jgi:hypothetical protein
MKERVIKLTRFRHFFEDSLKEPLGAFPTAKSDGHRVICWEPFVAACQVEIAVTMLNL